MPVWKFAGEETSQETALEAVRLELSAYGQSLEDLASWLRAHDGLELEDFASFFEASTISLEDLVSYLSAYYQSIEDAGFDLSTWGTDYKDALTWLAAFIQTFEDAKTDFWAAATEYVDLKSSLWVVATVYGDLKTCLETLALSLEYFTTGLDAAGYSASKNLGMYLFVDSGTQKVDFGTYLWATNGLSVDKDCGLCLMVIREVISPYAGTYQRLSSVLRTVS